jgi:hypothetical protein
VKRCYVGVEAKVFDQGNPDSGFSQVYFDYTKNMFQLLEFDVKDIVVVAGMRNEQYGWENFIDWDIECRCS